MNSVFKIKEINYRNKKNKLILKNLAQGYEAEFSRLTKKLPDKMGLFHLDTMPTESHKGYIIYTENIPIGFCILSISKKINEISEFYIIPSLRKKDIGKKLANWVFDNHTGKWQVKQIDGAFYAVKFWRKVIGEYTKNKYKESVKKDKTWGIVTCQVFLSKSSMKEYED